MTDKKSDWLLGKKLQLRRATFKQLFFERQRIAFSFDVPHIALSRQWEHARLSRAWKPREYFSTYLRQWDQTLSTDPVLTSSLQWIAITDGYGREAISTRHGYERPLIECGFWTSSFWPRAGPEGAILKKWAPLIAEASYFVHYCQIPCTFLRIKAKRRSEVSTERGSKSKPWMTSVEPSYQSSGKKFLRVLRRCELSALLCATHDKSTFTEHWHVWDQLCINYCCTKFVDYIDIMVD